MTWNTCLLTVGGKRVGQGGSSRQSHKIQTGVLSLERCAKHVQVIGCGNAWPEAAPCRAQLHVLPCVVLHMVSLAWCTHIALWHLLCTLKRQPQLCSKPHRDQLSTS